MSISPSSSSDTARGYSAGLLSALLLSTTAPFIRYLTVTYQIPPLVLAFWRALLVVVTLVPVLMLFRAHLLRGGRRHLPYLAAYGLMLAAFNSMWTISVALNGAAVATVLAYSSAAFTALLGWWLLRERLGWVKLLAVVLSLGGCALVSGALYPDAWQSNLMGIAAGVLTGLCYAGYSLMGRSAAQRGLNPWTTLVYTFSFATVYLLLFNLVPGGLVPGRPTVASDLLWLGTSAAGWGVLFLLAAGPTVGGFGMYNVSLTFLPSSVVNLIATSEPIFTAVIAYVFLGERLTLVQAAGGVMILGGVLFLRLYSARPKGAAALQQASPSV
jgi:drug/metabolite transporter (DMT)-like permease